MLDPDIKKLLQDLKMDDLVGEIEGKKEENPPSMPPPFVPPQPEPLPPKPLEIKRASLNKISVFVLLVAVALLPAVLMFWHAPTSNISSENIIAYSDDDEEEDGEEEEEENLQDVRAKTAASWAKQIVAIDPQTGKNIHLLWDMLRRRKEDLGDVATELSNLLSDNAMFRQDFYGKNASILLSRYQAIDARHSVDIASQIDAIYDHIKEVNNPDLTRAYAEMLGELGAESYTTHKIQIVKEIFAQEAICERALATVEASMSLGELEQNVRHADSLIQALQNNGIMQTFRQGQEYLGLLAEKCKETLDRIVVQTTVSEEELAQVERILAEIHANSAEIQKYRAIVTTPPAKPAAKTLL